MDEIILAKTADLAHEKDRVEEQAAQVVAMAEDLNLAHQEAKDSAARARAVVETALDAILTYDEEGVIESFNPAAEAMFGYPFEEIAGKPMSTLLPDFTVQDGSHSFGQEIEDSSGAGSDTVEHEGLGNDGQSFPVEFTLNEMSVRGVNKFTCVIRDIRERKTAEKTIRQMALTDPLTNLANRNQFHQRLADAVKMARREQRHVALLLLDLDKFKAVNDDFGHPIGDALLKEVARRLKDTMREVDTVARLGGDEFAVILWNLADPYDADKKARQIIDDISKPFVLEGSLLNIGTSIGIALFPDSDTDEHELIRKADHALYEAKSEGSGACQIYDEKMNAEVRARRTLDNDLRLALARDELVLHFQPQLSLPEGRLIGAEALVRWQHPTRGLVPPDEFIGLAESNGLIVPLGEWVLRAACAQNVAWQEAGMPPFPVAVNISGSQLRGEGVLPTVAAILAETGLESQWLEVEITETVIVENTDKVMEELNRINEIGVRISIDDFGTGYSSLAYLKRFPAQQLKIDRSFVQQIAVDSDDTAIVEAVINLGHNLHMTVIAEGVETEDQANLLVSKNCDSAQGFLYCKPLPAAEFAAWALSHDKRGDTAHAPGAGPMRGQDAAASPA